MRPIEEVAADLGFAPADLQPWGPGVAKIGPEAAFRADPVGGKLVLISAINPTPAGEGKTTCAIGLAQAARRLGARAACALREPSLGPGIRRQGRRDRRWEVDARAVGENQPRYVVDHLRRQQVEAGAADVDFSVTAKKQLDQAEALGLGALPICIAKTHLSLSDDERLVGRPRNFDMTVREVRIAAGAGFLVPLSGEITTMPGLPKKPHAVDIDLLPDGTIVGVQ